MRRARVRVPAALTALALTVCLIDGCASSADVDRARETTAGQLSNDMGVSGSADAAPTATTEPLPFDAVLIELFGTTDTDAYLAGAEQRAAQIVAECMADAGFEFAIPDDASAEASGSAEADTGPEPGTVDYARTEGFGVISGFLRSIEQSGFTPAQTEDPNLAYLRTLTGAEIERFLTTLNGVEPEPGQIQTDRGCNGTASDEAYADWERFNEALPNYRTLGEERDTHPDWIAARELWHDCMAARGYDYSEPDAIVSDVTAQMRTAVEAEYPGGQLPLVPTDDGFALDPAVVDLLDDMAAFERDAAIADAECTEPLAGRFDAVERLVQQDFVDRNAAAIEELLAASAANG